MNKDKILYNYFFILFSLIPISLVAGSAVSSINIVLISVSFVFYTFYHKEWKWLKNKNIRLLLVLYLYLIFNSFISLDFNTGVNRNFGFIFFVLFFAAFNYFYLKYQNFDRIFIVWFIIITIIVFDVYLEVFTEKGISGYFNNSINTHERVYSFFIDEAKVGGFVGCFFLILTGYFLNIYQFRLKKWKYLILIISIIFLVSIFLTGERSSTIRALIAFLIFFTINQSFSMKEKIISLSLVIIIFGIVFSNLNFIKYRYGKMLFERLNNITPIINYIKKTNYKKPNVKNLDSITPKESEAFQRSLGAKYIELYISSVKVFFNYPLFGVGNNNYSVVTCTKYASDENGTVYYQFYKSDNSELPEFFNSNYICNTHPHQIYFEFLAEHGIVGTLIILFVFFKFIYLSFQEIIFKKNNLQLGALLYVVLVFLPLLPGGSFFNNYVASLFWINLSVMIAATKNNVMNKETY